MASSRQTILICCQRHAKNLGDIVISDCLAYLLREAAPQHTVRFVGLTDSRRTHADGRPLRRRRPPGWNAPSVRRVRWVVSWLRRRLAGRWRLPEDDDAAMVVFGGGQLLMDNHLHFPLKLAGLAGDARRRGLPVAWHACGVGSEWSPLGHRLLSRAITRPQTRFISLRDRASCDRLQRYLGERLPVTPEVTIDPAVWAAKVYEEQLGDQPRQGVGLGITAVESLRQGARQPGAFERQRVQQFWIDTAVLLHERHLKPILFTNGAPEDAAFADEVAGALTRELGPPGRDWHKLPRPDSATELVRQINGFESLIAHRLHANIIGFALRVPTVALVWDQKVEAFAEAVGRQQWLLGEGDLDAGRAADAVADALANPVCEDALAAARELALATTRRLVACVGQTADPPRCEAAETLGAGPVQRAEFE